MLTLRPPQTVMQLGRLGAMHQTPLSFARSIIRKMMRERWDISHALFDLDANGYGTCVYRVATPYDEVYSVVLFSNYLADEERTDRVIAEKWDIACALVEGEVNGAQLHELRENVPKQEAGRNRPSVLVLSRANKSGRNFNTLIDCLARGEQPNPDALAKVGYLVRTTAVYGNGKFGIADYTKVRSRKAFNQTFAAQMFAVYMIRHFSSELVEHIAKQRSPTTAVPLAAEIKRYLGVGNATGLGMALFLVKHPQLVHAWLSTREKAIARVIYHAEVTPSHLEQLNCLLDKAIRHFQECFTPDERQQRNNTTLVQELKEIRVWLSAQRLSADLYKQLAAHVASFSLETQESLNSLLLELHAELICDLETETSASEQLPLDITMTVGTLRALIETDYRWALEIDFDEPRAQYLFWYRSAAKEEPRLGERYNEPGAALEMRVGIGRAVQRLYHTLTCSAETPILRYLLDHPQQRGLIRRIQADTAYGEIQSNLLDQSTLPIHLLRCKLAMFGASKFDPKSDRWVRITLFQGAPLVEEIGEPFFDAWNFPIKPVATETSHLLG